MKVTLLTVPEILVHIFGMEQAIVLRLMENEGTPAAIGERFGA